MSKLEDTIASIREESPLRFAALNGTSANELRALNTRWKPPLVATELFESEAISRFRHGVVSEIGVALMEQARASASQTLTFNKNFAFSDVATAIVEQARALGEGSIVVVSPTGPRVLQIDPGGLFKRNDTEIFSITPDSLLGLVEVGEMVGMTVMCNPQASDPDVTLILGPNWFQYSSSTMIDTLIEGDEAAVVSDLKIEAIPQAIRAIHVQAEAIEFR